MKHILLIAALLTSFAFCPWGMQAQTVVKNKQNAEQRDVQNELNKLARNMVYVEGGTFMMGADANDKDAYTNEIPAHQVTLSSYYICKYEVTQFLWKAVMGSNPSYFKGDNLPVEQVSWDDCQVFIGKLNALTGLHYRLPTEAEWEFAARGGNSSHGYKYSGSNTLNGVAWYSDNSGFTTHPVGSNSPNELGLYDMSGNVWEWCSDWYASYNSDAQTNPAGPSGGAFRVYRGGSFSVLARYGRTTCRSNGIPDFRLFYLGLRLVRS